MSVGKILLRIFIVLVVVVAVGLATFYIVDGHPLPETEALLDGRAYSAEQLDDGSWLFSPTQPNDSGVLIMHGALIKPQSYARSAAFFAGKGYTVLLPYGGPGRLSINAIDTAGEMMRELDLARWYTIGHSMGGMASLSVVKNNADLPVRAAALWATAMPADFSALTVPMIFLWGDNDGLLPAERFEQAKSLLPDDVRYVTLTDANHQDFAMYGHQFFDKDSRLGWEVQIDAANEATLAFFRKQAP